MKIGVVDTGGGLRGIYASGVLDGCLDQGISFDVGIGVSAGSANLSSYFSGQKKRNYQFYTEYMMRKKYMSFSNFLFKKTYIDMDYVYGTLSNSDGENPLDYPAFAKNPAEFIVVATDANTGEVHYFNKNDISQDHYDILKASCAIPFVCKPYEVDGRPYYDGALGDPIPIEKAFAMGCDKVVLILTKPKDLLRTPEKDEKLAARIEKKYPFAARQMRLRASKYNEGVALAKKYEEQGILQIIAPDDTCGLDTLTRKPQAMKEFYEKGLYDSSIVMKFLK
ncbi:patatin family protein [[Clostridium] leptum]|uniref:Patatin family protein n=1 Tax=Solibaculum mannosilyticum TaxID=2780922 RepID=A0A7I8D171_9FIRM|nr:patatin family protein [Solibaculum mannosilyticum]MCO7138069.1 patatin family protein [[Clostridium] leptum]BCI60540.1 patatin family protein [Solibaculum mannosilyticum]